MPHRTKEEIYRKAYDQLCAYMDEHNLRHTAERFSILSSICTLQRFTVDDLRYSLTGITISRATVYNTLELMEKAGIIRRIEKEYGVQVDFPGSVESQDMMELGKFVRDIIKYNDS